jgi:hypothetical protein
MAYQVIGRSQAPETLLVVAINSIRPRPSSVPSCLFSFVALFAIATVEYSAEGATLHNVADFSMASR